MSEESKEPRYYWSRCRLGEGRFYWVVGALGEGALMAEGYCATVEKAERAARAVCPDAQHGQSYFARRRYRLKVHERRKSRPKGPGGAEVRRFVYVHADDDCWLVHPILKITPKRVFVGRECHLVGDEEFSIRRHDPIGECASLDRARFERDGTIYYHKWKTLFHRDLPGPSRSAPNAMIEQALVVLDLEWPAAPEEIRAAYRRRAFEAHPETGGTDDEFRRVQSAYGYARGAQPDR